jgi:plasmid stabilization system protein ParE
MRLRVTRRAFSDRQQIRKYLSRHSTHGARSVLSQLDEAMDRIRRQPNYGTPTDVNDVSVVFVGRYPYKIFYRVRDGAVQILHIRHT